MLASVKSSSIMQLFTGKETIVLKSLPAVVALYFTASEKENLRTERKQNYFIENEKIEWNFWLLLLEQQKKDRSTLFFSRKLAGDLFPRKF